MVSAQHLARIDAFCTRLRVHRKSIPTTCNLGRVGESIRAFERAGLRRLIEAGCCKVYLEKSDPAEFAAGVAEVKSKIEVVFGVLERLEATEEQKWQAAIRVMSAKAIAPEYYRNIQTIAEIYLAAGLDGTTREEVRLYLISVFCIEGGKMLNVTIGLLRKIKEAGKLSAVIGHYPGLKGEALNYHKDSIEFLARVILLPEADLIASCTRIGQLSFGDGDAKIYPARRREAQLALCVAFSEKRLGERVASYSALYQFPSEVYDYNPTLLTAVASTVTPGYAASVYLKTVSGLIAEGKYERAKEITDLAMTIDLSAARVDDRGALEAYQQALPKFMAARGESDFETKRENLREAYRACSTFSGQKETRRHERLLCLPLIERIKIDMGRAYYAYYENAHTRLSTQLAALVEERDRPETAAGRAGQCYLEERALEQKAREELAVAYVLQQLRPHLSDQLMAAFIFLFVSEEEMTVTDATVAALKVPGQAALASIASRCGKSADELIALAVQSQDQREIGIAAKYLLVERYGLGVSRRHFRYSFGWINQTLAGQQVWEDYSDIGMVCLVRLAAVAHVPLSAKDRRLILAGKLVEKGINRLIGILEGGTAAALADFWPQFYRSVVPGMPAETLGVCREFDLPPFVITERAVRDPARLRVILEKIEGRGLLFISQAGLCREWFRLRDAVALDAHLMSMQTRVGVMRQVGEEFGLSERSVRKMAIDMIAKGGFYTSLVQGYQVAAEVRHAAENLGKVGPDKLKGYRKKLLKGIDPRNLLYLMLRDSEAAREAVINTFSGVKREAMLYHKGDIFSLITILLREEEHLKTHLLALEGFCVEVPNGDTTQRFFPFKTREAALCFCVLDDLQAIAAVARRLIETYKITQAVFEANPRLLYRAYVGWPFGERAIVSAFYRAAVRLRNRGTITAALEHLAIARERIEHFPTSTRADYLAGLEVAWREGGSSEAPTAIQTARRANQYLQAFIGLVTEADGKIFELLSRLADIEAGELRRGNGYEIIRLSEIIYIFGTRERAALSQVLPKIEAIIIKLEHNDKTEIEEMMAQIDCRPAVLRSRLLRARNLSARTWKINKACLAAAQEGLKILYLLPEVEMVLRLHPEDNRLLNEIISLRKTFRTKLDFIEPRLAKKRL